MKLTKSKLVSMIKEELQALNEQVDIKQVVDYVNSNIDYSDDEYRLKIVSGKAVYKDDSGSCRIELSVSGNTVNYVSTRPRSILGTKTTRYSFRWPSDRDKLVSQIEGQLSM